MSARRLHGGVGVLLGAALGVGACNESGVEGELGARIARTVELTKAQVEIERQLEEHRRKGTAESDRIRQQLAPERLSKAVYGAPPPRDTGSSKKPCKCPPGDPLCSCL